MGELTLSELNEKLMNKMERRGITSKQLKEEIGAVDAWFNEWIAINKYMRGQFNSLDYYYGGPADKKRELDPEVLRRKGKISVNDFEIILDLRIKEVENKILNHISILEKGIHLGISLNFDFKVFRKSGKFITFSSFTSASIFEPIKNFGEYMYEIIIPKKFKFLYLDYYAELLREEYYGFAYNEYELILPPFEYEVLKESKNKIEIKITKLSKKVDYKELNSNFMKVMRL